jgi:pimeloyl-ACP methyl ester carboxylesterase
MEAVAHTLAYDAAIIGDRSFPAGLLAAVTVPALVVTGEQSPPFLGNAAQAAAKTLPNGQLAVLPGQGHDINPDATARAMAEFLAS